MMRSPLAAGLAMLAWGCIPACTRPADPADLAVVERLIRSNEQMQQELNRMDAETLHHMSSLFEAERPAIERRFQDTLLPREAEVLGNYYRAMGEQLPRLLDSRNRQHQRLDSMAQRLLALRHDLEQGIMRRKQREQALAMEQQWDALLRSELDTLAVHTRTLVDQRRTLRAAIDPMLHP